MRLRSLLAAFAVVASAGTGPACKPRLDQASSVSESAAGGFDPASYSGHSDYRLILVRRPGPAFDPNVDVLKPGAVELAAERVSDALRSAAMTSLVPVIGFISGQRTGSEGDLMPALMGMAKHAGQALRKELAPITQGPGSAFPIVAEAMIIPWTEPTTELSYDDEKISMNAGLANVLGVSVADDQFPEKLTTAIKTLQAKLHAASPDPWYLLAARQFLFVMPGKSRLTLRILIGMKPLTAPFAQEDARVKFSQVVVPDQPGKGIVASATFDVDLAQDTPPSLTLEFGDFKGYEKGNYVVDEATQSRLAPRLEGQVNKTAAGWVGLNFSFKKLAFNLRTAQVSSIETLLSPGLRVGGANWVVGGLRVESVDQSFQNEINGTIDQKLKGALDSANDQILDGMMSKEMMEKAFKILFARGQEAGA